jgi:heme o synthase
VVATQLAVGWVNDWLDADRDRRAGRRDKPVAVGEITPRTVGLSGLLAALAIPLLGLPFGPAATVLICLIGVFALLYDWPLKSTALSVLPYLVAFGLLPAFVVVALPGHPAPPAWLVAAGALLGGGAHFANVLPDLRADAATGVRGLPQRLGPRRGVIVMALSLAAASVVLGFGPAGASTAFALTASAAGLLGAAATAVVAGRRPDSPASFRVTMAIALLDVVLLIVVAT